MTIEQIAAKIGNDLFFMASCSERTYLGPVAVAGKTFFPLPQPDQKSDEHVSDTPISSAGSDVCEAMELRNAASPDYVDQENDNRFLEVS